MSKNLHAAIVGHAGFPQGLLSAAQRITGSQEGIAIYSNRDMSVRELARKLSAELDTAGGELYIFVDLVGGSSFNACRQIQSAHTDWVLISGVNLPMLVTYLSYRTRLSGRALLEKVLEGGRRGMQQYEPQP